MTLSYNIQGTVRVTDSLGAFIDIPVNGSESWVINPPSGGGGGGGGGGGPAF